jgi:hypothetical protein
MFPASIWKLLMSKTRALLRAPKIFISLYISSGDSLQDVVTGRGGHAIGSESSSGWKYRPGGPLFGTTNRPVSLIGVPLI